jgi:hypothetical protein
MYSDFARGRADITKNAFGALAQFIQNSFNTNAEDMRRPFGVQSSGRRLVRLRDAPVRLIGAMLAPYIYMYYISHIIYYVL